MGLAMHDISRILERIELGEREASEDLLPLVYDELRSLARAKLAQEQPGQTLQATALVHEAYLRLVGPLSSSRWDSRVHFFAAAAEAMRRILIEAARRKHRLKRGGELERENIDLDTISAPKPEQDILALSEALDRLALADAQAAELVKLRYFVGLSTPESAEILGFPLRTTERLWAYARAWLYRELTPGGEPPK